MTEDEADAILSAAEAELQDAVQQDLEQVAAGFADSVDGATELVAAAFSVSSIRDMWRRHVPGIMTRLRAVAHRSARATAEDLGQPVPTGAELDAVLGPYQDETRPLVESVGDSLAEAAQRSLAEGVNAGEDLDQLKARLTALFAEDGPQLGPVRAARIASTESVRAYNAGVQAAASALTGEDRPLVKQWLTRRDNRVREAHRDVNGQLRLLDDPFDVGGFEMRYPGDPLAPAELTVNCRCVMVAAPAPRTEERTASVEEVTAAAEVHTGAMVALMPSEADAARLALASDFAESADQLHVTLFYLGEGADWGGEARDEVRLAVSMAADWTGPVAARAFGAAHWNPGGESAVWVWNIGDDADSDGSRLADVFNEVRYALEDRHGESPEVPRQFTPWAPHIAAAYSPENMASELAERCGPVVFDRIRVAFAGEYTDFPLVPDAAGMDEWPDDGTATTSTPGVTTAAWYTPDPTGLAFENRQTGDGRVFAPGALSWDGDGPWPLMANENFDSHDGAALAGSIEHMALVDDRLDASGPLYLTQDVGREATLLLAQGAPLGVSVDLDDVDLELVDATGGDGEAFRARLLRASVLPVPGGGFFLRGDMAPTMTASGTATVTESVHVAFTVGPDGLVPAAAFDLSAAAGDPDTDGVVVDTQRSSDYLMRITRGRVRGATLVSIPAFAEARIVLVSPELFASAPAELTADAAVNDYERVVRHVRKSQTPVTAAVVADFLKISIRAARRHLARAAQKGDAVRLTRGTYTRPGGPPPTTASAAASTVVLTASVTGSVDLPVAPRDLPWDGDGATDRVFDWADDDPDRIGEAYAYRDDDADPTTKAAYKLGYADVIDGQLTIVPRGVFAAQGAMEGSRGGVDIPEDQRAAVNERLAAVRAHVDEETGEDSMNDLQASAWQALAALPDMPAAWFREPTLEELPPGGPGVNYAAGRIFGWVAQADVPHEGFRRRIVINELGPIDTTGFLRQHKKLDDGSTVRVGAFTMNAGHHRDGAECETAACQFDDTRTVAGVITVGMNERGMWFSGAAAPWLSEWDREVFAACQPSYHLKQMPGGRWKLGAVLSVPVPGHPSALLASAVAERSQLALTAAAMRAGVEAAVAAEQQHQAQEAAPPAAPVALTTEMVAAAVEAAMDAREARKAREAAELEALLAEGRSLVGDTTVSEGN